MVDIEIDGKKFKAEPGSMIIEVADANDVYIPRFCYHKKLSVAANCRMCLVEVGNIPKPVPACATPIADGMVIQTQSERARAAQKAVMEFLLINHPLDCPICDQGGECELQDLAMGYGDDVSRYSERKRVFEDKDIGPLIASEMTRCIQCTRCVRFGQEIAGMRELGALGRGEFTEIGTYIEQHLTSEVSGNVIDLCPVGALTAKPSRYTYRAWELTTHAGIAAHDCLGSNIEIHTRRGRVMRVVPRENEAINEVWLSDRDRFSYEAINSERRLQTPRIKENGTWKNVDWHTALEKAVGSINGLLQQGADNMGVLASPSATTEELFLLQKLARSLGINNIDSRLQQQDFSDDSNGVRLPLLGRSIESLDTLGATLLVGSNLRSEQPIAALRLRKATREGKVFAINQRDYGFNFRLAENCVVPAAKILNELAAVLKASGCDAAGWSDLLADIVVSEAHTAIATALKNAADAAIILGEVAQAHPDRARLIDLATRLAEVTGASFGLLTHGCNAAGAAIAGAVAHGFDPSKVDADRVIGRNAAQMITQPCKGYLLLDVEPDDFSDVSAATSAFDTAEMVIALTPFADGALAEVADVMLPIATFAERGGTYINATGEWQTCPGAVKPVGEARPAWKVLRVLANFMELPGFQQVSFEDILRELKGLSVPKAYRAGKAPASIKSEATDIKERSIYETDSLVRRAAALQASAADRSARGLE